jgi:3-deoxy-D-manno-octulosonate 8-phosphate phosphatase (KDO 8-P phosphatase)
MVIELGALNTLTPEQLVERAARIRLLLTDCDGVLTDGGVYYGDSGEVLKRFNIRDGMGVARLRAAGIETGIITGETSPSVARRAEKLRLEHVHLGVSDKLAALPKILERAGLELDQVAFIGDDVNDLGALSAITKAGLTGAPNDAMQPVLDVVHYRTRLSGGHGAFRELAEWILSARTGR